MKLLLAEDEHSLSRALVTIFEKNNYTVDAVYNGADALSYIECGNYDCIILDIMMPVIDGISVLKSLRKKGNHTPVLLLTAKGEIDDKVLGLDSGANDYLTKPFDTKELLARIRAITRGQKSTDSRILLGNTILDRATFELITHSGSFRLANKEFQMLEMLMLSSGIVIPVNLLMEKIWGYDSDTDYNVIWVYISYLRKKLSALDSNLHIKAMRNVGYLLEVL